MKKLKNIILLLIITLMTTGCMKLEVTIDIKKDKSMTFGMIQAIDKTLLEESDNTTILEETEKKELEKQGFNVEPYSENNMEGYKIIKSIDNIDTVSTEKDITSSLDVTETEKQKYLFTVKKGFLKNTYKAKFESVDEESLSDELNTENDNTSDSSLDYPEDDYMNDYEDDSMYDYEDDSIYSDSENSFDDLDYSALMSGMELSMKVNLPNKAINSNATSVTNDGKSLTWDMLKLKDENIEFEFEIYNTNNIIICGVAIILIIIIIVLIIKGGKSKKQQPQEANNAVNNFENINQNIPNQQQPQSASPINNFTPVQNTTIPSSEMNQNLSQNNINNSSISLSEAQSNNNQLINQNNRFQPTNSISEPQITNNIELQPQNNIVASNDLISQTNNKIETSQVLNTIEITKEQSLQATQNNTAQSTDIFSTNLNNRDVQTNTIVEPQIANNTEAQPQNNIMQPTITTQSTPPQETINKNNPIFPE